MIGQKQILAIGNDRLRRLATYGSIAVASVLLIAKLGAWLATDSVAMLSSLFDSAFDLVASMITAYAVSAALKPPDLEHRYGHGKAEPLAALAQSAIIIGSSLLLAFEAASRLYRPHDIQNEAIGYAVMGGAIVLTVLLVLFQRHVVRATGSVAVGADQLHYIGDLAVNLAVVAAFVLQHITGQKWFDPLFAIGIASGMAVSAFHLVRISMQALMDAELPGGRRDAIRRVVLAQPGVHGVHDMRTRSDGDRVFIEAHVEMDGAMPLSKAHDVTEQVIAAIRREVPNADVTIHQDPAGHEEDRLDARIEQDAPLGHR